MEKTLQDADYWLSKLADKYWARYEETGNELFQKNFHEVHDVKKDIQKIIMNKQNGCRHCPNSEDILPMETVLYNAFGGYVVYKNGEHFFSEDPAENKPWEDNMTLICIEEFAKKEPNANWTISLDLPLRGATWTRKNGQWLLTDTNQGFA